jgi:hypothetical protein
VKEQQSTGKPCPIIYVDDINVASILSMMLRTSHFFRCEQIQFFNTASPMGRSLLRVVSRVGICNAEIKEVDYSLGDLRTEDGKISWQEMYYKNLAELGESVKGALSASVFIRLLGDKHFQLDRLLVYYEKKALYDVLHHSATHIHVVDHLSREASPPSTFPPLFFVQRTAWYKHVELYAKEQNVELRPYWGFIKFPSKTSWKSFWRLVKKYKIVGSLLKYFVYGAMNKCIKAFKGSEGIFTEKKESAARDVDQGVLAISYGGPHLTFDPSMRSDFFWWPKSGLSPSDILLYFERPDIPLDRGKHEFLKEENIRYVVMYPEATTLSDTSCWSSSARYIEVTLLLSIKVLMALLRSFLRGETGILSYAIALGPLIQSYAYWFDFYQRNRVKVNIEHMGIGPGHIGRQLALQDLGGVTVSHQYAFSNRAIGEQKLPPLAMPCANVVFSFSQNFYQTWRNISPPVEQFVAVGYIYDAAFKEVVRRSSQVRKMLHDKGVEFILCYFDESSGEDKNSILTNDMSSHDYEFLFNQLLEDKTLGLVCKPKKPYTLFERISRISELIKSAQDTGRFILLDEGGVEGALSHGDGKVNWTFPSEAGLIADVAIGDLIGGTAALESFLAGTRTVLIDSLQMFDDFFYKWGRDEVVFEEWDVLFEKMNRYRRDTSDTPGFGDWSGFIDQIASFRDGQANKRVGEYLRHLLDALRRGNNPSLAMQKIAEGYIKAWGRDTINSEKWINDMDSPDVRSH